MATTINDVGTRIMNDHGVYPLQDTITNNAILSTINGFNTEQQADLYVDAKGFHLVWRQAKKDKNGDAILNGGNLLLETKSVDITAEFAKKLDYDGETPDFNNTAETNDDDPWFITSPEVKDGYMFTICGLKDDEGIHLSHVFATDDCHIQLLLSQDCEAKTASLEHALTSLALKDMSSDDIERAETDADIISKAKELLK